LGRCLSYQFTRATGEKRLKTSSLENDEIITMKLYPLKFKPIYKQRIWGGDKLKSYFGKDLPKSTKIGESWELADLPGEHSEISNGFLAGKTIDEALAMYPLQITGKQDYKPPFPLLIKLLDAQDVLSLQVHPDINTCRQMGKGAPKTECWYMIDVKEGGYIYKGLKDGTTREQFRQAIEDGSCADYLNKVPVKAGECHFLPSGTAHAIGEGLLIAEIQQPSDTTYRVFDWNRIDETTGKPRQLHISDALESINFGDENRLSVADTGTLVDENEFRVDKGHREKNNQVLIDRGLACVIVAIKGQAVIESAEPEIEIFEFQAGDTFLIPAQYKGVLIAKTDIEYLTITTQF
jgi:mannose-6-phosphate isomerase